MSTAPVRSRPSTSTSRPNFLTIFNAALEAYKGETKNDLASHPLLPKLESCDSPEAILTVLRKQIFASSQSQNGDDVLPKSVTPIVNVLYSLSTALGGDVGLAFSPTNMNNIIFAGIDVLLLAAGDASSRDKLIGLFVPIEHFFRRLEVYTGITPTAVMTEIIVDIMVDFLSILAIATKGATLGQLNTDFKKFIGNRGIEDGLRKLDKLTQKAARVASAELLSVDVKRNQLRDQFLRWLSPSDPSTNHNITRNVHHDGTAQWFLQGSIYNQWKSTGSFLWVQGNPGSGKTVLCSSIIQDIIALSDAGRASMACFYFDIRDVDKQSLHNLLPSLLCQLSARSDARCDKLSQLYSAHNRGVQKPSDHAMVECLKQMLALEEQWPTYIILDALDESPVTSSIPPPREVVLELVKDLVELHLPSLHICVTSRPEFDIQIVLKRLTERPVFLHDESGQREDIVNYIYSSVHSDRRMGRWREGDKELVIKMLSEKAAGMFRWVFCQLELLQQCFPPSVRRFLEELPDSLDETYERMLREIERPIQGHAHRLLQCLVVALRPLEVKELAEVLAFDFNMGKMPKLNPDWRWEDQEEAVMSACSSLVTIVKNGDSRVVQFSHYSVREFLTADRLAEPIRDVTRYYIQLEAAHTILAQVCLGVLLQLDESVDRVDLYNIDNSPFARYAAQYWATHARFGNASSHVRDAMECLFDEDKPHFATWLWMYNEDRGGHSMSTIRPEEPEAFPLYYAARLGFQELVEHLIVKRPEQVNARGGREMTPMHAAMSGGHVNILRLLLEHGADVGSRNKYGETLLHGASWSGKLDAGRCLFEHGADINAQNEDDWTPLFHAVFHGHTEFARMLIRRGAMIDARSGFGSTPLHAAVRGGEVQAVRLLLEHGADVNARDSRGWTPSRWKSTQGPEMVELLAKYGAEFGKGPVSDTAPSKVNPVAFSTTQTDITFEQGVSTPERTGTPDPELETKRKRISSQNFQRLARRISVTTKRAGSVSGIPILGNL